MVLMPAKNSRKTYAPNGYYHLYNRGVEKRTIFQDEQDYGVFLSYLKEYLLPKDEKNLQIKLSDRRTSYQERDKIIKMMRLNNFNNEIELLAYCLMPNHFHFFVKQHNIGAIDKFMNSLGTRYTMYFNKKYKRVGSLYQGVYKGVLVSQDNQFVYLSKYIHMQALNLQGEALQVQPSSFDDYLGLRDTKWVHPEQVLIYFSQTNPQLSYSNFVKEIEDSSSVKEIDLDESP